MHPIHDVDALLLLAISLAAKRRPAEALDIVAAIDLIQNNVPSEDKLSEGLARLGAGGLLVRQDDGVALTEAAEKLIRILPRKGDHAQRQFELKGLLGAFVAVASPPVEIAPETLRAAILAHRAAAAASTGPNLLVPKAKPEAAQARPGQRQRKPLPKQRKRKA